MKTGWYNEQYYIVKPLHNGYRQSLIVGAQPINRGYYNIMMGVFSCNISLEKMLYSNVWNKPTSTNKNPSIKTLTLALEALTEIEQEVFKYRNGKKTIFYIDGLDERRLHVFTKVLTKKNGYKLSKSLDINTNLPKLYKTLK